MVRRVDSGVGHVLRLPVKLYRAVLSPILPPACRFEPSCSQYADEALATHGAVAGGWLTAKRLGRCHPWGSGGFDPVPHRTDALLLRSQRSANEGT